MNDREIMKQALEALEIAEVDGNCCYEATELLRTLLTQPAPQPEQKPVAWMYQCPAGNLEPVLLCKKQNWAESGTGLWVETPLYTSPQPAPQPEQEPVAIPDDVLKIAKAMRKDGYHGPLSWAQLESLVRLVSTATPPPPQRKPLTDEWIHRTTVLLGFNPEWTTEIGIAHAIVRAAEAAHGIKENT
jgi:hypothetical protein